jgi:hypothetical protein
MKNFLRIATGQNIGQLMLAIHRQPDLWHADTYLRDFPQGPFEDVDSILLRFPPHRVFELQADAEKYLSTIDQHESVDQAAYARLPEARSHVMGLMSFAGGERLGRVMINRIRPGGRIFPHADTAAHVSYYTRFHLCLQSDPGYVFRCGDESVFMAAGEIWRFDNSLEHEVVNNGKDDRISMVVDIRTMRPPAPAPVQQGTLQ